LPETLTSSPPATLAPSAGNGRGKRGPGHPGHPGDPGHPGHPGRRGLLGLGLVGRIGTKVFVSCIGLVILAVLWQVLPSEHIVDPTFVTPFNQVCSTWWHMLQDGVLWSNTRISLLRGGVGFGAALILGVPLGLLIGANRWLATLLNPVLDVARNTAPLALLPVFILVIGIGETTKFVFIAYSCLFPILLNTISAVKTVDPLLVKSARAVGFNQFRIFQKVVLPASVPQIFSGIRLSAGYALLVLIAAELVGANSGLGFLITNSEQNFQTPMMYAAIITVTAIGVLLNFVLLKIERHFSTWRVAAL
jgi:NitT/TauT family transport system permease protein